MLAIERWTRPRVDAYVLVSAGIVAGAAALAASSIANANGIVLTMTLAPVAVVHYFVAVRHYGLLSPDGLFFAAQLVMAVGTFQLADQGSAVDAWYATIVAIATATYMMTSTVTFMVEARGGLPRVSYEVSIVAPSRDIKIAIAISIVIVVAYFKAVGYSALLLGIQGWLSGNKADVASLRLDSYAGQRYLFPGYVNQFKNAILPGLAVVYATWAFKQRVLSFRIISWLLVAVAVLGLMWTGQRGAFVSFVLTVSVYAVLCNRKRVSRWMLAIPVFCFPPLLLATVILARGGSATGGILDRFFNNNQQSGIAAFRYTYPRPTQLGREWMDAIYGVLPGNRGSMLSSEVFATLYGSNRGTAPPSLWGSIHFNFGFVGVIVGAVILGVIAQRWTCRSLRGRRYNTLQLMGFAGATVSFGTWIADGLTTLLNVGILAYAALYWWGCRIEQERHSDASREQVSSAAGRSNSCAVR